MKIAVELLKAYLDNIRTPADAASLFSKNGVLELPTVQAHAKGPAAIEKLIAGIFAKVPDFRFKNVTVWIDTPDRVFSEYSVEAPVVGTDRIYRQTYAGILIAEHGKIKLLREALDTAAAEQAFGKNQRIWETGGGAHLSSRFARNRPQAKELATKADITCSDSGC